MLLAAGLIVSCAGAPKKPTPVASAKAAVVVEGFQVIRTPRHFIIAALSTATWGLVLDVEFIDGGGDSLGRRELRIGPAFGGGKIVAGREYRVPLRALDEGMVGLKVAGRRRPLASSHTNGVAMERVKSVRLQRAKRCKRVSYAWKLGMPGPEGIRYVPRPGEVFQKTVCDVVPNPVTVLSALRFERVFDPDLAKIEVIVEYSRDFEQGVQVSLQPLDSAGRPLGDCLLWLYRGIAYETETKTFRLSLNGKGVGVFAGAIAAVKVAAIEALNRKQARFGCAKVPWSRGGARSRGSLVLQHADAKGLQTGAGRLSGRLAYCRRLSPEAFQSAHRIELRCPNRPDRPRRRRRRPRGMIAP